MSPDQYHSLCNELYERIRQKMELRNDDALRFSPRGTASEVLGDDALQSFYDTIEPHVSPTISEEDFIRNIHTKSLHDFLATLIFASCSYEAAVAFATSVVPTTDRDKEDCGGRTSSLPVDRRYLEKIFRDIADVDRFLSKQPCFCAVVLRRGQEITFKGPAMQRLPYIHESLRGTGDFGKVYSVKIAKGHFHYGLQDRGHNAEVIELARKDYMKSEDFINAKSERDIMKQILQSRPNKCENILESYGSIEFGETYSLFMPLAIADLKQYMIEYHPLRPSTMKAKADIVRCALGLAQGLDFLHTKMKTPNFEDMICYHMDLKPSNILIFPNQTDEGYIWKLSDFGMSKVIVRQRGETIEEEKDFDSWFLRRKQPVKDASPSGVQNRRGDGTYFAPESIENSRSMGTKSDVWSLGCVISIVMTYLEGGKDKVLEYEMKRLQHAAAGGLDQFFVRSRFQHATLHPVVNGWHDDLIQDAQQRNRHEGRAVQTILHMLRDSAFNISPKERCTAARIVSTLERACLSYREAISISDSTPVPQAGKPDKSWPWTSLKVWNKRRSSETAVSARPRVERSILSSSESFKGCKISPDAKVVAYWTDTRLVLFSANSAAHKSERSLIHPAAEYSLEAHNCFWRSVDLTSRLLVACTTQGDKCYVFKLNASDAPDVNLSSRKISSLGVSEIYKVAISANGKRLACVVRRDERDATPSIMYTDMSELLPSASTKSTVLKGSSPNTTNEPLWHFAPFNFPTVDIPVFTFSNPPQGLYIVIQPELSADSREHIIPVSLVNLDKKTSSTLNLMSTGFDSSSVQRFYTTFAPVPTGTRCAVITREKRLHVLQFGADADSSDAVQKYISHYRLQKLISGPDDTIIYALGTRSPSYKISLLEISLMKEGEEPSIREITQVPDLFHDDDFEAMFFQEGDERYILICILVGSNGRFIYRVDLQEDGNGNGPRERVRRSN